MFYIKVSYAGGEDAYLPFLPVDLSDARNYCRAVGDGAYRDTVLQICNGDKKVIEEWLNSRLLDE
jgi:hypothetical protein